MIGNYWNEANFKTEALYHGRAHLNCWHMSHYVTLWARRYQYWEVVRFGWSLLQPSRGLARQTCGTNVHLFFLVFLAAARTIDAEMTCFFLVGKKNLERPKFPVCNQELGFKQVTPPWPLTMPFYVYSESQNPIYIYIYSILKLKQRCITLQDIASTMCPRTKTSKHIKTRYYRPEIKIAKFLKTSVARHPSPGSSPTG